jgi:acyl carrier protein
LAGRTGHLHFDDLSSTGKLSRLGEAAKAGGKVTAISSETIMNSLREIMLDVFDLDELTLTPETTADDVEEWDSLSHVRLVVAVERKFGFRFTNSEIESLKTVGDLVRLIQSKAA